MFFQFSNSFLKKMEDAVDDRETMEPLLRIRELTPTDYAGFDSLPHQVQKKRIQDGFIFNILLVGETGIGKSTLISSLFNITMDASTNTHLNDEVNLNIQHFNLEEKGINLKLTVVETVGYGDQINRSSNIKPIIKYIEFQFEKYLKEELNFKRSLSLYQDTLIHACLYFICPTGHSLKSIDLYCMKELHDKVNIIPIVAKSDSLPKADLQKFKRAIKSKLENEHIKMYHFPTDGETAHMNYNVNNRIPLAVTASGDYVHIGDKALRARVFPWGTMLVEDEEHSEFLMLKDMLIVTSMEDLKEKTYTEHYERYRRNRLAEFGFSDLKNELNVYQLIEKKRCDQQRMMLAEEEKLKQAFDDKIRNLDAKFKEQEMEMQQKYNKLYEELRIEEEKIEKDKKQQEAEITLFKNKIQRKKGRTT